MGTVSNNARTYGIDTGKRHLLTAQNLVELGITWESLKPLLNTDTFKRQRPDGKDQFPEGISINEMIFGNYVGQTAASLGWMAYMNIGVPLIEERANIIQPAADVLSTRAYVNQAGQVRKFDESVEFVVSNTINWSLQGTGQLTFGGSASGQLQVQLEKSLACSLEETGSQTQIAHNHKDNIGSESQTLASSTATNTETGTATGSATGTGELSAELMLGITGSISGTLTTSWTSKSSVSGEIPATYRVETMATQRRQVRQFIYELPITLTGYVALYYTDPVSVVESPPQDRSATPVNVIAREIRDLKLIKSDPPYRSKGVAETVSTLAVEHIIFESESIYGSSENLSRKRPHYI